jgi:hypothetical protein
MIITLVVAIIAVVLFRFFSDLNKDNDDLYGTTVHEKFGVLVDGINSEAFNGMGTIIQLDKKSFNLYGDSNQIVHFMYSTGHLTITWKYKYFQKEVVHERTFTNVRNISIFDQQRIAEAMIKDMIKVVAKHKIDVVDF